MTQKTSINLTSTDRFPIAQFILRFEGIDCPELRETQQTHEIDDWFSWVNPQFIKTEHLTSLFAPIHDPWMGSPTETASDAVPENENQDWERLSTALLPAEVQSWVYVEKELAEIREEVKETCAVAEDVHPVPQSAYDETSSLLAQVPRNVPMPDMMWLESGGIGLEWRPGDGIVTMSLYGDNHVNLVIILGKQHEIAATCPLSDHLLLPSFLEILSALFQQRT